MCRRSWKLVAADESTVLVKPLLDAVMVKDSESERCFANPPTPMSDWFQVFCEANDLPDRLVSSETGPRRWGRRFSNKGTIRK